MLHISTHPIRIGWELVYYNLYHEEVRYTEEKKGREESVEILNMRWDVSMM